MCAVWKKYLFGRLQISVGFDIVRQINTVEQGCGFVPDLQHQRARPAVFLFDTVFAPLVRVTAGAR